MLWRIPFIVPMLVITLIATAGPADADHVEPQWFGQPPIGFEGLIFESGPQISDFVIDTQRGLAYVSVPGQGLVLRITQAEFRIVDTPHVGVSPTDLEMLSDGNTMAVASSNPAELLLVDLDSFSVKRRIPVGAELGVERIQAVRQVDDETLVVIGDHGSRRSSVVTIDLVSGVPVAIGDGFTIEGDAEIFADYGNGTVIIGTDRPYGLHEFDLQSGALLRSSDPSLDLSGTEEGVMDPSGTRLFLWTGRVIDVAGFTQIAVIPGGTVNVDPEGGVVYSVKWDDSTLRVVDAATYDVLSEISVSCRSSLSRIVAVNIAPAGEHVILSSTSGVCLEPLDGGGESPAEVTIEIATPDVWPVESNIAVFDQTGRLAAEFLDVQLRRTFRARPGEYSFLVFGVVDARGWPHFARWVGGRTLLDRDGPELQSVEGETRFEIEMLPVFYDIRDASETFWDAIFWLQATGITTGCASVLFCPNDFVTRGQMAAFLDRALDLPPGGPSGFVDDGGTFRQNIWNLRAAGITTGCAPDRFCTDDFVTRGQMAAFLDRALGLPVGGPSGFVDDGGTFRQNIWNLRAAGITTGCAPDRFCTDDFVTRAQMAAFLERALADDWPHV
jgi:DNA-binding beta-propeller fold protein YncE